MAQQTAVEWLIENIQKVNKMDWDIVYIQAKEMEKEQRIADYNVGYQDAQCNHINDAENYANEIDYLQSRIDEIDSKIKAKQNSIADMLINGNTNNK
jgi:phosphopentomutase